MNVSILLTANDIDPAFVAGKNAIVIDALRATSVITTALRNGAKAVYVAEEIEEAKEIAESEGSDDCILCGERQGLLIDGFHLDNSPFSFTPEVVSGKNIVLTTTNGTKAIRRCKEAQNLYIGCFLNASYVVKRLLSTTEDLVIACAGTAGQYSMEDFLCAGVIINELITFGDTKTDDMGITAFKLYRAFRNDLDLALRETKHYNYLKQIGFEKDIEFCLQQHIYDTVPVYKEQAIVAYR